MDMAAAASTIPAAEAVDHLGTLLRRYQQGQDSLRCTVCPRSIATGSTGPATKYCPACYELLCTDCSRKHERHSTFRDHVLVNVGPKTVAGLQCSDHMHRFVQRYCLPCDRAVCMVCTHSTHRLHKTESFVAGSPSELTYRKTISKFLESTLEDFGEAKVRIQIFRDESKKLLQETKRAINKHMWDLMKALEEQERHLYDQIDEYYTRINDDCERMEHQIETSSDALAPVYHAAAAALTPLTENSRVTSAVFPLENYQQAFTDVEALGKDLDLELPRDIYRAGVGQNLGSVQVPRPHVTPPTFNITNDTTTIQKPFKLLWEERSLSQTVDLCFVVEGTTTTFLHTQLEGTVFHVGILDLGGNKTKLPRHVQKVSSQFCTVGSDISGTTSVILTNSHDLCWNATVLQKTGAPTCITLSTIGIHPVGQPVSLAISLKGNYLVATMADPERGQGPTSLRSYSPDGGLLWCRDTSTVTSDSGGLLTPWSISVDPLDRILVADMEGHCVQIYSHSGEHLHTVRASTDVVEDWNPSSVTTDRTGAIYVASYERMVVSLFTPNGRFIRHLVQTDSRPKMISVCDKKMVVATEAGIQMYQM